VFTASCNWIKKSSLAFEALNPLKKTRHYDNGFKKPVGLNQP
jgi:hypothetical protein